jgi:choline transport protein
MDPLTSS